MRVFEEWEIIKIWRKPGNLESMKYENVCLPGRRLWRKAGSREVPPILEDFDPCRSSKCARFYTKSARLRYRLRSRSSSRSNQTETRFIPHDRNLVRQIYKRIHTHTHMYIHIYFCQPVQQRRSRKIEPSSRNSWRKAWQRIRSSPPTSSKTRAWSRAIDRRSYRDPMAVGVDGGRKRGGSRGRSPNRGSRAPRTRVRRPRTTTRLSS